MKPVIDHIQITVKDLDSAELLYIGANIVLKPAIHPEYSENYYAVYFKDNQNIKYEIVCDKK